MRCISHAQVAEMSSSGDAKTVEDSLVRITVQNALSRDLKENVKMTENKPKKKKGPKTLLGVFEIIPDDMEGLDELMEKVIKPTVQKADGMVETYHVQDIAFGAKKIIARIILKERDGGTQPLEDALMAHEEIQRAECSMVSIIS